MKHVIIALYDKPVDAFGRPFVARTHNEALRQIQQQANRVEENNMLNTHSADYSVYDVGEWDDETGNITGRDGPPEKIAEVAHLRENTIK